MGKLIYSYKVRGFASLAKKRANPQKTAVFGHFEGRVRTSLAKVCEPSLKTLGFLRGSRERRFASL